MFVLSCPHHIIIIVIDIGPIIGAINELNIKFKYVHVIQITTVLLWYILLTSLTWKAIKQHILVAMMVMKDRIYVNFNPINLLLQIALHEVYSSIFHVLTILSPFNIVCYEISSFNWLACLVITLSNPVYL